MFIRTLQMVLRKDLTHQTMNLVDFYYQWGKIKGIIWSMKDDLCGKIMAEFVGLALKMHSYLIDDRSGDKKVKVRRSV